MGGAIRPPCRWCVCALRLLYTAAPWGTHRLHQHLPLQRAGPQQGGRAGRDLKNSALAPVWPDFTSTRPSALGHADQQVHSRHCCRARVCLGLAIMVGVLGQLMTTGRLNREVVDVTGMGKWWITWKAAHNSERTVVGTGKDKHRWTRDAPRQRPGRRRFSLTGPVRLCRQPHKPAKTHRGGATQSGRACRASLHGPEVKSPRAACAAISLVTDAG